MANVSGWKELMNESIVVSAYTMYNDALSGNIIMVLWVTLSSVLYMKTKNIGLTFMLGVLAYAVFFDIIRLHPLSISIMTTVLVFELAIALYQIFWSR